MAIRTEYKPHLEVGIQKKLKGFDLTMDFEAEVGCLGILGPSGCGKSMTLKSIAGIVTPDAGRIALQFAHGEAACGRVLYDKERKINLPPQERRVGYLFQNYALFPNMTVEQNITAGLTGKFFQKKGMNAQKRAEIAHAMIERFRLDGLEKRYPTQLSGGQQQRVALARILAYEPEVLLLDEPFSAMDSYLREGLRLELLRVMEDFGGIAILVTHDRDEAYQLCSHLLLMDQGEVIKAGRTREIFQNPGTTQAARLTGCKNISKIERLNPHRVRALDWGGLELVTKEPVSEDISFVGIRAHDLEPVGADAVGENLIPVGKAQISEMPFEWYVTLENGLWWKVEKTIHTHDAVGVVPEKLRIAPEALLLLS